MPPEGACLIRSVIGVVFMERTPEGLEGRQPQQVSDEGPVSDAPKRSQDEIRTGLRDRPRRFTLKQLFDLLAFVPILHTFPRRVERGNAIRDQTVTPSPTRTRDRTGTAQEERRAASASDNAHVTDMAINECSEGRPARTVLDQILLGVARGLG